jgi:hypothetical protein
LRLSSPRGTLTFTPPPPAVEWIEWIVSVIIPETEKP